MYPKLPKRIVLALIIVFFFLDLWLWYAIYFQPPRNLQILYAERGTAYILWQDKKPRTATVFYTANPYLLNLLPFTAFLIPKASDENNRISHLVKLANLDTQQKYYLAVVENFHLYKIFQVGTVTKPIPAVDFKLANSKK